MSRIVVKYNFVKYLCIQKEIEFIYIIDQNYHDYKEKEGNCNLNQISILKEYFYNL